MNKRIIILFLVVLLASIAACLSEAENPLAPTTISSSVLLVDTGYTNVAYDPGSEYMLGELFSFTMRWTEVENAQYYEVRASETPITAENWNAAIPMTVILAPADTADVFTRIEVQEEPCIACGLCEQVCPMNAVTVQGGVAVIDYNLCTSCGQCQDVCPVEAISGTRVGVNYYFGIRAFYNENSPADEIAVTGSAQRIIYYNNNYLFDHTTNICGCCHAGDESSCFIIMDYDGNGDFCGYGCPVDAIWQDFFQVGNLPYMVYIDYDECISCGVCLFECWNYGAKSIKPRVVPAGWVTDQPLRP